MSIGVLIAVQGPGESAIAAAVGSAQGLAVARRCADLTEALAVARAGIGSVVVVSEQALLHRGVVSDFTAAGIAVVGVASSPGSADRMRGFGVDQILAVDADAPTVVAAVMGASSRALPSDPLPTAPTSEPTERGVVIAVWGPTGAPGRTTLAVSMAYDLAQQEPTLLVDVDTYGGAVAQALGLQDEAPGVAALARASLHGNLTPSTVNRHALQAAPGLRVLSGVTRADRWTELSATALEPVWEILRTQSAVTVVDCGFGLERDEELQYDTHAPQRNGATLSALAAADVVVAVGTAEPLGVQRLVHALADLESVVPADTTPRIVVVNRVRATVAGQRPREAVADALRRYSAVESVWTVGWDPRACDAATLAGQALAERAPRSAARKAIRAVALAARDAAVAAPSRV